MLNAKDGGQLVNMGTMALVALMLPHGAAWGAAQFNSYQTHSHFIISSDPSVTHSAERIQQNGKTIGLRLTLNNVKDEQDDVGQVSDPRTERVSVSRTQGADGYKVVFEFLLSERAKKAGIEFFDYRNKTPSEVALDYWLKSEKVSEAPKAAVNTLPRQKRAPKKAMGSGALAKDAGSDKIITPIFAGCGQPLHPAKDGFTFWKIYHRPFAYRGYFDLMPADAGYVYPELKLQKGEKPANDAKELGHYRLAHKLYKEGKYALALRTIDFFESQFPKSRFRPELDFLRASTLVQISRMLRTDRYLDQALEVYRRIVLEAPDSVRGKAALAFIVQEMMGRGTPIFALEYALMGAEQKSEDEKSARRWVYRLAAAESLYALGEYDRAERAYQLVMDQENAMSPEAAFRIGEVFAARKFWERAIISYEKAIRSYPKEAAKFPTTFFNLAEAYFRLEKLDEAERAYGEFVKRFGTDDMAWAAEFRLAELAQMKLKGPDPKQHDPIREQYEGVVNRYPYSPGAMMAELRLAECYKSPAQGDRIKDFFSNFFAARELKRFESAIVDSNEVEIWMDLAAARFYYQQGDYRAALGKVDNYRVRMAKLALAESFQKVYSNSAIGLAATLSQQGAYKELLAAAEHYGGLVLKPEPVGYLLSIARAQVGEGNMKASAEKLAQIEARLNEASDNEKDHYHLLKAEQAKLVGENAERIIAELSAIRDGQDLTALKYDLLAQTAADKGDLRAAIAYDSKLLDSELGAKLTIEQRIAAHVRRVESVNRQGSAEQAAKLADQALLKFGVHTEFPILQGRLRELRAQAFYDAGRFKVAVEALDEILAASPNHPRRSEFEFMRGKGLARIGRETEAYETFRRLAQAADGSEVWKKSAKAELDQLQWENNVSNLIKDKDRRSSQ